jgi:hypothetical protein
VKAFPDLGGLIINLKKDQLNDYWNEQIATIIAIINKNMSK